MVVPHSSAESAQARARLVAALREQGVIHSEPVAQAFLSVPREIFVTWFYEQQRQAPWAWEKRTPEGCAAADWIAAIYQDRPLVMLVDERQRAISSSSMPTVMAMMLEALSVQPGMRVLEIGAGSGYNAALLAHLTGDGAQVTTIELEEELARTAHRALSKTSGPVSVHVGDGRLGVPERAPYERLIATVSASDIPRAWYEHLAPGGRLVMDLQGSLQQSSFLILDKAADGSVRGRFDPRPLSFMPLRSTGEAGAARPVARLLREPVSGEVTLSEQQAALLHDASFLWFLQWEAPGMTLSRAKAMQGSHAGQDFLTLLDANQETLLQLYHQDGYWSGRQHGGAGVAGVWETIERASEHWRNLGRPALSAYEVVWDEQQERCMLVCGQRAFPL